MDNPGLDSYNVEADDVRSERRQREIAELLDRLERFSPTLIAVEDKYGDEKVSQRYEQFLKDEHELSRSETEQIGFQLAKRLGLETVHPVDYPMWMNGWRNDEIDWERLRQQNAESSGGETSEEPKELTEDQRRLIESSVSEYLAWINSDDWVLSNHANYMNMLLPSSGLGIYSRTDSVRNWYERNLRIFTNLNRVTDHGKDRVLLIIGSGHVKILRDFIIDAPYFCFADTAWYLLTPVSSAP